MKKVNLKAYLIAAFCLIVFAGFTLAQTESAKLGDVAKTDSNEIELARQKKHLQRQKELILKRWRRLKPGMTEKQVQKILGRPKLIQGGSHECVWFYQFLPVSNAKRGSSDVGGVKDGFVFLEAKSVESLILEEEVKHDKIIAEEKARCKRAISIEQTSCDNAIIQIDRLARPVSNEARRRMRDTAIATRKAMRNNAIAQHEIRRNIAITRAESKYKGQVKRLRDRPLAPVFALSSFNHPDWGRFEELLANKKPGRIKPPGLIDKWKMLLSWRKLRINMRPGQVHALLGEPERIKTSVEGRREYYGDISGHGELHFTARPDLEEYLHSWREPFWPAVEKELAPSPTKVPPVSEKTVAGNREIDVSYGQVMEYLSNFFSMEKSTPVRGQERYMGQTSDSLAVLEIIGNKNNISQATLMIGIPADAPDIVVRNTAMLLRFLKNTVPEWTNSSDWATAAIKRVADIPGISDVKVVKGNKLITMTFLKPIGMVSVTVKHK